jgi:mannose-6-phosphate isomerase
VHALGAGIVVYEVQQPSDITYRLDDWGRLDAAGNPREMHVELGLASVKPLLVPGPIDPVSLPAEAGSRELVTACRYFATERITLPAAETMEVQADETPQVVTCLEGAGAIESGGATMEILAGGTLVVPAVAGTATVRATSPVTLLRSWVPNLLVDVIVPARAAGATDDAIAGLGGPSTDIRWVMEGSA